MVELLRIVKEWQELIGAILGGIFALMVAWYVARSAQRREERSAGMVVLAALLRYKGAHDGAIKTLKKEDRTEDNNAMVLAALYSVQPQSLEPRAIESMQRLFVVHDHLAAHLSLIAVVYADMEHPLRRWITDQETYSRTADAKGAPAKRALPREEADMLADARTISRGAKAIAQHASCAIRLIELLLLSRLAVWNRLCLRYFPEEIDRLCAAALKTGEFTQPPVRSTKKP